MIPESNLGSFVMALLIVAIILFVALAVYSPGSIDQLLAALAAL
jgi:hypothetical protein